MSPGFSVEGCSARITTATSAAAAARTAAPVSRASWKVVPGTYVTRSRPNSRRIASNGRATSVG